MSWLSTNTDTNTETNTNNQVSETAVEDADAVEDIQLHALFEYLGVEIDLDKLARMDADERKNFIASHFASADLTDEQVVEAQDAIEVEVDKYYAEVKTLSRELAYMIKQGGMTVSEVVRIELLQEDLDDIINMLRGDNNIIDNFEDALKNYESKNVEVGAGESYTHKPTNPQDGDVYFIEGEKAETGSSSIHNNEDNKGWLDLEGNDGYNETNPDADGDGFADRDFNGDGITDEYDFEPVNSPAQTTFVLDLPTDATVKVSSYDAATNSAELIVTLEDGTKYKIIASNFDKLVYANVTTNAASLDPALLSKIFEKESSVKSLNYHTNGSEPIIPGNYKAVIDMSKFDEKLPITVTEEDFLKNKTYEVNFADNNKDHAVFHFPPDAVIKLENIGALKWKITATMTMPDGTTVTVTVNLNNFQTEDTFGMYGGTLDPSTYQDIKQDIKNYNVRIDRLRGIYFDGTNMKKLSSDNGYEYNNYVSGI